MENQTFRRKLKNAINLTKTKMKEDNVPIEKVIINILFNLVQKKLENVFKRLTNE